MKKETYFKKSVLVLTLICAMVVTMIPITSKAAVKNNRATVTLAVGESQKLKVSAVGVVKWSSRNPKVATVTQSGKVTARSTGTATITAKVNKRTYKTSIKVDNPRFNKSELTLVVGDTYDLDLIGTERRFEFESTDPDIAEVDDTEINAVDLGDCIIYAYNGKTEVKCIIHVVDEEELYGTVYEEDDFYDYEDNEDEEDGIVIDE